MLAYDGTTDSNELYLNVRKNLNLFWLLFEQMRFEFPRH